MIGISGRLGFAASSALALALSPVIAQPASSNDAVMPVVQTRGLVLMMTQTYDGVATRSVSQKVGLAQSERGGDRWMVVVYGEGAAVEREGRAMSLGRFENRGGSELGLLYDAGDQTLSGDDQLARFFNLFARPLIDRSPAAASARWTLRLTPDQLGIVGTAGGGLGATLSRQNVAWDDRRLLLVAYTVPAFSYRTMDGANVAHWARGAAVTDLLTGEVLWNASLHRAVGQDGGAQARPYRYAMSAHAFDEAGRPKIDVNAIDAMRPLLEAIQGEDARSPLPIVARPHGGADQAPLELATLLDLALLSAGLGDTGLHAVGLGGFLLSRTGANQPQPLPSTISGASR